jgi:hypothetical protein
MYAAVLLRFGPNSAEEKNVMIDYRTRFPAPCYSPGSNAAGEEANRRVAWVLWWRKWMPPVLGASGPLVTAVGFYFAVEVHVWPFLLISGVLTIVLFLFFALMMPVSLDTATKTSWKDIPTLARVAVYAVVGLLAVGAVICFFDPVTWGLRLGPVPIFFGGMALLIAFGTLLAAASRESHLPLFSMVVIILSLAHLFGNESTIRYLENPEAFAAIAHCPTKRSLSGRESTIPELYNPTSSSHAYRLYL